jgi:hypothetical protein
MSSGILRSESKRVALRESIKRLKETRNEVSEILEREAS